MVTRPAEAEARLAFTGLTDVLDGVEEAMLRRIPVPQRHAIDVALLRADPGPSGPDQRAIAVATLSLLRRLAGDGPVLIAVDDAQWLDQSTAQTLAFVARVPEKGRYGSVEGLDASAEAPRHITGIRWHANGLGYIGDRPSHVFVVDAPSTDSEPFYEPAAAVRPAPTCPGSPCLNLFAQSVGSR